MPNTNPIPKGYHTVTPYMTLKNASQAIEFYKKAFGAVEVMRMPGPDGTIGHAEVRLGDSVVMLAEARGEWQPRPGALYLYVHDTDAAYQRALQAGATSLMEPADQFYGDRAAKVKDPFGYNWHIHTHIRDVPQDELEREMKKQMERQMQHV